MTKTFDKLPGMYGALEDIHAERRRQIEVEGWTPQHDDQHDFGDLAAAGACYALNAGTRLTHMLPRTPLNIPVAWPWDKSWWKPSDKRRDLVKAGALIVAEIERLDRVAANKS